MKYAILLSLLLIAPVFADDSPRHWRLAAELKIDGRPVQRKPLNREYYQTAKACIDVGVKVDNIPPDPPELNINGHTAYFLVGCFPYHQGEDSDESTPI